MWPDKPLRLRCAVQHYDWGRAASQSIIPQLAACLSKQPGLPHAELWIGAHEKAPAFCLLGDELRSLSELLTHRDAARYLGAEQCRLFGSNFPFLLKVLSIGQPLSIQAHPDLAHAAALHRAAPDIYLNDRHKPEVAVALSPVSLLFGFRPLSAIRDAVEQCPELAALLNDSIRGALATGDFSPRLTEQVYRAVMTQSAMVIEHACSSLVRRLHNQTELSQTEEYIVRVAPRFPRGDAGLFAFHLLNLVTLEPGEAVYIPPNVLHCYLTGELVECQANSDNVVRGGLTTKFTDVETLLAILDFSPLVPDIMRVPAGTDFTNYPAPAAEFSLSRATANALDLDCVVQSRMELLFCYDGEGDLLSGRDAQRFSRGEAFLVPASLSSYRIRATNADIFRVCVPES